jgi:prepilin-type processing-associated H-X9-DG protein
VRMTDITEGASNTILLAEAGGRPGVAWCAPEVPVGLRSVLGGPHRGANVCMADGSVRFLRDTLDLRALGRLATRAGGETVRGDEWE